MTDTNMIDLLVWRPTVTLMGTPVDTGDISYAVGVGSDPHIADKIIRHSLPWYIRYFVTIEWTHTETIEWL